MFKIPVLPIYKAEPIFKHNLYCLHETLSPMNNHQIFVFKYGKDILGSVFLYYDGKFRWKLNDYGHNFFIHEDVSEILKYLLVQGS